MIPIEKILNGSRAGLPKAAWELFHFQSANCAPYREYVSHAGFRNLSGGDIKLIPFLPIEFFKSHMVYCGADEPEIVFTSSTTGGGEPSRHYMAFRGDYEKTFRNAFRMFYGDLWNYSFYCLLPGYLERKGSSLVYMANNLIRTTLGGFYLNDYEQLLKDISTDNRRKVLLGVSYALLDLAEKHRSAFPLQETIIMETGGMKGRREEMPKEEFHKYLKNSFKVKTIHSEYGMAELSTQAYSYGDGRFETPPWMKVLIRDLNDPFSYLPDGQAGGINIIDLANRFSCAFIQTQDIGRINPDGTFSVLGRIDHSEIRGCNLLIQ